MTISDDELTANLARRAEVAAPVDLTSVAQAIAANPQRGAFGGRTRLIGVVSAAASVAVALVLAGSIVLRNDGPASQPPAPSSAALGTAAISDEPSSEPSQPPSAEVWTDLVWGRADDAAFAFEGNTFVQDAVADGDGFLAVGYSGDGDAVVGRIWRTTNGSSWDLVGGDWFRGTQFDTIVPLGSGFVIVGAHRQADVGAAAGPIRPAVWWSADLTAWEERTPEGIEDLFLGSVIASSQGSILLFASDPAGNAYWLRGDAELSWTRLAADWAGDVRILSIAAGGPGWIATGATGIDTGTQTGGVSKGAIWTSPDAVTWSPAEIDQPGGSIGGISRVGGGYLASGSDGNIACSVCLGPIGPTAVVTWFSTDGRLWRRIGEFETRIGNSIGNALAADGHRVLAFESEIDGRMRIEETLDGVTWHPIGNGYRVATSPADVAAFPDFGVPIVGNAGLIAFGYGPDDADASRVMLPIPWFASAESLPGPGSATFPPRPPPVVNDFPCPNQEPCGP